MVETVLRINCDVVVDTVLKLYGSRLGSSSLATPVTCSIIPCSRTGELEGVLGMILAEVGYTFIQDIILIEVEEVFSRLGIPAVGCSGEPYFGVLLLSFVRDGVEGNNI